MATLISEGNRAAIQHLGHIGSIAFTTLPGADQSALEQLARPPWT
jgi:hypothetical protein